MFAIILVCLFIFFWQHAGTVQIVEVTPSFLLMKVATVLQKIYYTIGIILGNLAREFMLFFKFEKLAVTVSDLSESLLSLISSPYHFIKGYLSVMTYNKTYIRISLHITGSVILFALFLYTDFWCTGGNDHACQNRLEFNGATVALLNVMAFILSEPKDILF